MSAILTCVLCGRRGTHDFVMVAADPNAADTGHRARCAHRAACRKRIETRNAEAADTNPPTEPDTTGPVATKATAASLAGLAREVEQLRTSVVQLRGIGGQVEDLARVVAELAARVEASLRRPKAMHAPSWLDLPGDIDTTQALLTNLIGWLGEVYLRYADAVKQFPECWMWHPDVVEELLWLMVAWHAAYRVEDASVALAGDWHDRQRPGVVKRIKTLVGSCSLDNHRPGSDRTGARPMVPVADALTEITAWWASQRDEAPPAPSEEQLRRSAERAPVSWGGRR